jgi:succinate dehydrogenase/fumarate reductase cytochrome b subunit
MRTCAQCSLLGSCQWLHAHMLSTCYMRSAVPAFVIPTTVHCCNALRLLLQA